MTREEWEAQEKILDDGLKFYLTCLEDKDIPHPEIKPRTAQYIHEKYNTGVIKAIALSNRVQARFANLERQINNIPW